ncbi:hypothetical protein F5984_18030 [Rudanella paleaurantiibacter]|uniref:Outer membrane beta-barrel protein n=1 Tax=Rudanella paleaurantiibacter TaxID=2614655 RepID=A0A7J5TYC8_9BACT|nr:hypothetical protein [Rudanella paleaurantiibacter]KAB7728728.1 hypothetical protein F5984_18030 [Rudanella paleaurantiibacter]
MRHSVLTFLFICFITSTGYAQTITDPTTTDVLLLRNGWVLRGQILSALSDSSVTLETRDGNRFVFPQTNVLSIRHEKAPAARSRGYGLFVELGPLAARNTTAQAVTTAAITFHVINGFRFSRWLYAGLGTGVDLYATQTFVPFFASVRGDLSGPSQRQGPIPFYFVDGGYGFNATVNDTPGLNYIGGAYTSAGLGLRFPFVRNTSFLLSGGYYLQRSIIEQPGRSSRQSSDFNRVAIRAGFTF